jgi:hypothetical protein
MAKRVFFASVLLLLGICASSDVLACGDKFLVISRGTRFQRSASTRSAADILVYASSASTLPKALARVMSDDALRKAGYRPVIVENTGELDQALRLGTWSLVIVDLPEARAIRDHVRGAGAPMLLPVALSPTGTELAEAKKDFQRVVKGPIKSQAFLMEVDDALALRQKLLRAKPTV